MSLLAKVIGYTLLSLLIFDYFFKPPAAKAASDCALLDCHGLNLTCGPLEEALMCNMMYQLGDFCRGFAKCGFVAGKCQLLPNTEFDDCKACVDGCMKKSEITERFDCESDCRKKLQPESEKPRPVR